MEYSLEISASTTYFTYTRIEHLRIACEKEKPLRERDLHCFFFFLQNKKRKNREKKTKQAVDLLSKTVTVAAEDGIHLVCRGFAGCAFSLLLSYFYQENRKRKQHEGRTVWPTIGSVSL